MADKVLPQRVSAASVRGEGAELLEGGGATMLPSQGSWGDEVLVGRSVLLGHILPASHFYLVPNQPGRFLSHSLGGGRGLGCAQVGQAGLGQTRSSSGLGWRPQEDPKPLLSVPLDKPGLYYLPVTAGRLLGTVTGSKLRSALQLCDLGRALQVCSLCLK